MAEPASPENTRTKEKPTTALWKLMLGMLSVVFGLVQCVAILQQSEDRRQEEEGNTILENLEVAARLTVPQVAFLAGGQALAVTDTYSVNVFDVLTPDQPATLGRLVITPANHVLRRLVVSNDGFLVAAGEADNTRVLTWHVSAWPMGDTRAVALHGQPAPTSALALAPDGQLIASGAVDGAVRFWRTSDRALGLTLIGRGGPVNAVAFSPDGKIVVSGDETVRLWRLDDGELVRTLDGHTDVVRDVAFSPDGSRIVSGSADKTIRIWNVADGTPLQTLVGHTGPITRVVLAPDGQTLASASEDRTVRIWQLADGAPVRTLQGHESAVTDVAYSPDGQTLVSVLAQYTAMRLHWGTVRLWRVSDGSLLIRFEDEVVARPTASPTPGG